MRRERLYLEDIVSAADEIAQFIGTRFRAFPGNCGRVIPKIAEILHTEFTEPPIP